MASRSISRRQIIYLRDTDKSRYFAITVFNNCFIIRSPSLFFLMKILGKRSDLPFSRMSDRQKEKRKVSFTHMQNIICSQSDLQPNTFKTQLYGIAHKQTIICRQLFAGHVVGSRPMKRKKNLLRIPTGKYDVHVRTLAMNLLGLSLKLIPICLLPFFFFFFFSFFYDDVFAILSTS